MGIDFGCSVVTTNIPEGFAAMVAGEVIPKGAMWLGTDGETWCPASIIVGELYTPRLPQDSATCTRHAPCIKPIKVAEDATVTNDSADVLRYGDTKETTEAPKWAARMGVSADHPKDPKTKYLRPMYPAWNDPQVHTDANGKQYINADVYSVLDAFDPDHEAAHAVKKLLAAGSRDKGSKIQDYREAIISIEAAIYRAEIEGGNG